MKNDLQSVPISPLQNSGEQEEEYNWQKILDDYEKSNLTQAEFCKQRKLIYNQFIYQNHKRRKKKAGNAALLAPVIVQHDPELARKAQALTTSVTFQMPSGIKLSIAPGAQCGELKAIMIMLGEIL
jgi:hypothetical protein